MQSAIADEAALRATLERLVADGEISRESAESLRERLPEQLHDARYVLRHLGAHLGIGVIFAFDVVPLPLGTIARVSWVAGSRVVEGARGNWARARIHSLGVLLIAAVPWFGYAAYLLPLRRRSPELAYVLANHTWLGRTGRTYESFLSESRAPVRRLGRTLVPRPGFDDEE
ncbi:MAG: hypothetical protein QNK05_14810 [Myxococcota bacterium]|nr:hypothetical protein [Myxococcota bacterium]